MVQCSWRFVIGMPVREGEIPTVGNQTCRNTCVDPTPTSDAGNQRAFCAMSHILTELRLSSVPITDSWLGLSVAAQAASNRMNGVQI